MRLAKTTTGEGEIYTCVQGEGKSIGKPVAMVRLSGCNLNCSFGDIGCDSSYTWSFIGTQYANANPNTPKFKREDYVIEMTPRAVADHIRSLGNAFKNVVFTGGEPLLQQDEIAKVVEELGMDWWVELETNGTIPLKEENHGCFNQINCSPKLESSGNSKVLRHRPEAILSLLRFDAESGFFPETYFKFVVGIPTLKEDLAEIDKWVADTYKYIEDHASQNTLQESACEFADFKNSIYLMPEGVTKEKILKGLEVLNLVAVEKGYHVTPRMQILVYGMRRLT